MLTVEEEKVQIEALKLGYSKKLKALPTLEQILEENNLEISFKSTLKLLNKNKHLIDDKVYKYWLKIADKKLKK